MGASPTPGKCFPLQQDCEKAALKDVKSPKVPRQLSNFKQMKPTELHLSL